MVRQILKLSDPEPVADGAAIAFVMETPNGSEKLAIATDSIGSLMQFFASLALHVHDDGSEGLPKNDIIPIPMSGLGIREGATPDTSILLVHIGGYALGFETEKTQLAQSVERLAQTAKTLSAKIDRPN